MKKRLTLGLALTALAALALPAAHAQTYPSRPITLIVPFAPGASADLIARTVGRELSTQLGQPVVVDNKPGAGGALGLIAVARSAADGYTMGLGATGAIAVGPHLPDAPPLQPQRDLAPLAKLADIPLVLVASPASGWNNLQALLSAARKSPDGVSYGHAGQYTAHHLSGELLASMAHARLQPVPYKGSAPAITDLLGNTLPAGIVDLTSAYPHIKAGKLTALGVTSAARTRVAPEIPTIAEAGVPGYAAPAWMGLFLPAKTPPELQARLSAAVRQAMDSPAVQSQIVKLAAEPAYQDPRAFSAFIDQESRKWGEVIKHVSTPHP